MLTLPKAAVIALVVLVGLAGCGPGKQYAKAIDGQVIDADTGKPIPGAHVYYLYEGPPETSLSGHGSSDVCYHASAAVTDGAGRFHIDPWEQKRRYGVENWTPTGHAYAPGYVPGERVGKTGPRTEPEPMSDEIFRIKLSRAEGDARLEELWEFTRWGCAHGGDSHKNLFPAYRAVFVEAKGIAVTPAQKNRLDFIRYVVASAYLAPNPVADGGYWSERIREFMEKLQ